MAMRRPAKTRPGEPVQPWPPVAGFYLMPLVKGGVLCPVRIWLGAPIDPDTGLEMDRSPRWQALVNGAEADIDQVWPWAARRPVSEAEYQYRLAKSRHAAEHEPDMAEASPNKKVNLLKVPTPW